MDNNRKKRKHLSTKILIMCTVFTILLSAGVAAIGISTYYRGMMKDYKDYLKDVLVYVQNNISGDALEYAVDNNEKTSQYVEYQKLLDGIKNTFAIKYIYILDVVSDNPLDSMNYIISGNTGEDYTNGTVVELNESTKYEYGKKVTSWYIDFANKKNPGIKYFDNTTSFGRMLTAAVQIKNTSGKVIGVLSVDIEINLIYQTINFAIKIIIAAVFVITGIFLLAQLAFMRKRVIYPINRLQESAEGFINNSRDIKNPKELSLKNPEIHTNDELETLSEALINMSEDMKKYMNDLLTETKNKERIGAELSVATQIQDDMLPHVFPTFPEVDSLDLFALMNPAKEVGGDFYDFYWLDEDRLAFVVADVSGKGVPAAMFMVIAKIIMKNIMLMGKPVEEALAITNNQLCDGNKESFFVTAWLGVINTKTGVVEFANAGHNPPIVLSKGNAKFVECGAGLVLGAMEDITYKRQTLTLEKGDKIYLYTDGVPESINTKTEAYGEDRMLEMMINTKDLNNKEAISVMRKDVKDFAGEEEQFDDITMLLLEYIGG